MKQRSTAHWLLSAWAILQAVRSRPQSGFILTLAFLGSIIALVLVMLVGGSSKDTSPARLVLSGTAVSITLNAAARYCIYNSQTSNKANSIVSWMMGSLAGARWNNYTIDPADAQSKIDYLKNAEELAGVSAVKNNRIVVIPLLAIDPSLRNADVIGTIAAALYPELFPR